MVKQCREEAHSCGTERGIHALVMHETDNVATSVCDLTGQTGAIVLFPDGRKSSLSVSEDIPVYHKFALRYIPNGELVLKYGCPIGRSKRHIQQGEHVHLHNMVSLREADVE